MERIIKYCREKYKILIPVMVILVLAITVFFLGREYKYDNYRNKKEYSVYQYFGGVKTEYTAIITYNLRDKIVDLKAKDKKINYDSTPVYYQEEDKVLFPKEMNLVFSLREGSQYKINKYSNYYTEKDDQYIINNNELIEYDNYFLFDGEELYFFPNPVSLYINDEKITELGKMSYASVIGGYTLIYYDYEKDISKVIELDYDIVTVKGKNLEVNLNERYCLSFDRKVLLTDPNNLNPIPKTIDK